MNIAVLCGGFSAERDVSLSTAALSSAALRRLGHKVVCVDLYLGLPGAGDPAALFTNDDIPVSTAIPSSEPDLEAVRAARTGGIGRVGDFVFEICRCADMVFLALHGEDGEDGKIQAAFDLLDIKYTGTGSLGSALAMNKAVAKALMRDNGIRTPRGIVLHRSDTVYTNPGFPCVVKPCSGGSSVGTSIVTSEQDYAAALNAAFRYGDTVVAEQYINGRECDVGVLDGHALPVIEICPPEGSFYDYASKYQAGYAREICPAELPDDISERLRRTAEAVYRALQLDVYARMDFIVAENGDIYCLEGNTLPGMTPTSLLPQEAAAAGISYDELIDKIIRLSFKKYGIAI